jgi:hypothetical protein
MGSARNQVETPIVLLDALDSPAACLLEGYYGTHSDSFNLLVAHHWRDTWRRSLGMWQNPGSTVMPNVQNGAMPFLLQFLAPPIKSPIEFI